ncbi:hypothetical protein A2524_00045 [Candidatus Wolfebacteria bacterium RIFOXYD12_FULL_48_21]|uniref:Uncharacterized protein n=1 Tax=Candidatus Wolfebacteria bacterium RIFOXYD1_FULL_48_65 TaxID=1802561 RepID=A0A1F8E445_9BACT|nr:MAG: hypothetical protein A2524_00045 [Candidatus Wolfebacteria bacterium RIFOXYD12_FULL_48_21]OGM95437.1 MAG: hypothetical protein A2610_00930 [Candidatus Wolfebacteria bacterium RIFOXYD1_FULL_48_65]OGM95620.1 MAG: hypothetical protein A2532_04475 [Candidatus Wolfebacteria bacterium RIFOXYD2_FULL_48_11]
MKLKKIIHIFDKFEDKVRAVLSRHPVVYAMIGSIGIILLWRGIWGVADEYGMSSIASIIIGTIILLVTGLFVSFFVGEQIIISGINEEKRIDEETEEEIKFQSISRIQMQWKLEGMLKKMDRRLERLEEKFGTTPLHEKADKTQVK